MIQDWGKKKPARIIIPMGKTIQQNGCHHCDQGSPRHTWNAHSWRSWVRQTCCAASGRSYLHHLVNRNEFSWKPAVPSFLWWRSLNVAWEATQFTWSLIWTSCWLPMPAQNVSHLTPNGSGLPHFMESQLMHSSEGTQRLAEPPTIRGSSLIVSIGGPQPVSKTTRNCCAGRPKAITPGSWRRHQSLKIPEVVFPQGSLLIL